MKYAKESLLVLLAPILLLNTFGVIVSGIWLAFLSEWQLIVYGIFTLFAGPFALGLMLMPTLAFSVPAMALIEKGNKVSGYFLSFLDMICTVGLLTTWCIVLLLYCLKHADENSIIPILIWSYGIATSPIVFIAQKDRNNYSMITAIFIEVAYILNILAILFFSISVPNIIVLFGLVMVCGLVFQFGISVLTERRPF